MPGHHMSEPWKPEEDHQDPMEIPDMLVEELFWAMQEEEEEDEEDEEEALSLYSSRSSSPSVLFIDSLEEVSAAETPNPPQSPQRACPSPHAMAAFPWSQSEDESSSSQDEGGPNTEGGPEDDADSLLHKALHSKIMEMVEFLLLKYRAKEPTTKAEMLSSVIKEHQDHFPEIFSAAIECMQLVFGIDVMEVGPSAHTYFLVTALGLTYHGIMSDDHRYPNTGLLVTLLWVIAVENDCAPEEKVWEALSVLRVYDGQEHWIYGEPRELITKVWVQEQYLVYRQVLNSDPARYEFLWGPRAHAETTTVKALKFVLTVNHRDSHFLPSLPEGPECNENHYA
ncbi:PREDICTED: melanoma-associated antigen 8 [Myotis davidii]|uniref:Melanoma-associated antigen 10 n=1 Tax=Myotis davidii TaxID=225400 RepID=L5LSU7_MYODS|nr:PREDICTED: melanoma-associated antigen 8 [Myotis davidii]ELK29137.1 Melanoma-associated antigen 10 [Myotis davidii]